ncbi:hypothetical protein HMPREF2534_04535 [Bacteroides thetaiotaomicron]|nr:hypothetical protein HMPREF2534_04535 [Bacteroides thetaiotaomicron]
MKSRGASLPFFLISFYGSYRKSIIVMVIFFSLLFSSIIRFLKTAKE